MRHTILTVLGAMLLLPHAVSAQVLPNALMRGTSSSAVYYQAQGGRYVFPDTETYSGWFSSFNGVAVVSDEAIAGIPLRGVVPHRPGVRLVKLQTDPKVYAVDKDAALRWLTSEQVAIALYGSDWNRKVVDLPDALFTNYHIGSPIQEAADFNPSAAAETAASLHVGLGFADDQSAPRADVQFGAAVATVSSNDLLPDLAPFAPYDLRYASSGGRTNLKFTATLWNAGKGALEINTDPKGATAEGEQDAAQRIFQEGGGHRDAVIGKLEWHAVHQHYHYSDFGEYKLERMKGVNNEEAVTVFAQKTTFCMRDDTTVLTPAAAPRQPKKYDGCLGFRQGVSVGWADIYPYTLPDQYFDVTGLPAATYRLTFTIDPRATFFESNRANNSAATLVELNPAARTAKILGGLSPFVASSNTLPDGTLISVEGSTDFYVMHSSRKRKLRAAPATDTYSWPRAAIDVIPNVTFIRATGSDEIFMLNGNGWRRRVLSPSALQSYGVDAAVIAPVTPIELESYPLTDLVSGNGGQVYSISKRASIGALGTLSAETNLDSIHAVSDADFASYGFVAAQ